MPDAYLDGAYLKELQRRWKIMDMRATPDQLFITVDKNTVSPKPFVTHEDVDSHIVALAERAKANTASPEAEAALRRIIAGFQKGQPLYDEMAPELANAVRGQSAAMKSMVDGWGALKTITFLRVVPNGADVYRVEFENGRTEWTILPPVDGKVMMLLTRRLP